MINYALGFAFSTNEQDVLLIQKINPEWQRGKLNGIGGKVEANETSIAAMVREFKEEVGLITIEDEWQHQLTINGIESGFNVDVFSIFSDDIYNLKQMEAEIPYIYSVNNIANSSNMLASVKWLIPLILDQEWDRTGHLPVIPYR